MGSGLRYADGAEPETRLETRGAEGTAAVERLVSQEPNAEMVMASVENRNALNAALRGCLVALPYKEKTLLRLFFVDGMNIDQIGMIFGVHRATIARWLAVVRSEILAGVCRIMAANLRASRSEVRSLMGLSPSDIDINIGTIFAPTRARHRLHQTNAAA